MNRGLGLNGTDYCRPARELQPREAEALRLLGECFPVKLIAFHMGISAECVKNYLHNAYSLLGLYQLPEASVRSMAIRWSMARSMGLPLSRAADPKTRLLEDLRLSADWPGGGDPHKIA